MKISNILCLLAACVAASLQAGADEAKPKTLEQRLQQLEQQQKEQQQQIETLRKQMLEAHIDRKVAEEARKRIELDIEWKDGFHIRSQDNAFHLQVFGRVQFDGIFRLDDDDPLTSTFRVRRSRIGAQGHLFKYYFWKVEVNFSGGRGVMQDGWIDLRYWAPAQAKLGQFKQPFGLEEMTSSKYVKLVERSMASNFIAAGRSVGAMLHGALFEKRFEYGVGVFNGTGSNRTDENDDKDFAARLVFKPFAPSDNPWIKGLQLGGSVTVGKQDGSRAGTGPRTAVGTRIWRYKSDVTGDDERNRWGAEVAWHAGPFGLSAEYMRLNEDISLGGESTNSHVDGWHVTLSYFLTGEQTSFKRVKPLAPFDPQKPDSGWGAWELAARVGQIISDEDIRPFISGARRATQYMGGLNWYPNSMIRLSLDYQHAAFGDTLSGTDSEDSLMFRVQLEY